MKISVLIPAFNSAATIGPALESVLAQTRTPDEIIVLDDGSTDETALVVERYKPRVTLYRQKNQGIGNSRNVLCKLAQGDLFAFLDSDDLWHPRYLEAQQGLFEQYPDAGAFFIGHTIFSGLGRYEWPQGAPEPFGEVEVIDSFNFFVTYNRAPGRFYMSFCCLPRRTISELGEHLCWDKRFVEDAYLLWQYVLIGRSVVYSNALLAAYRLTPGSLSSNRLSIYGHSVELFQVLDSRFRQAPNRRLRQAFKRAFASTRRSYGKILMGCGNQSAARTQFLRASSCTDDPISFAKSIGLLVAAYLPSALQPAWPSSSR